MYIAYAVQLFYNRFPIQYHVYLGDNVWRLAVLRTRLLLQQDEQRGGALIDTWDVTHEMRYDL